MKSFLAVLLVPSVACAVGTMGGGDPSTIGEGLSMHGDGMPTWLIIAILAYCAYLTSSESTGDMSWFGTFILLTSSIMGIAVLIHVLTGTIGVLFFSVLVYWYFHRKQPDKQD